MPHDTGPDTRPHGDEALPAEVQRPATDLQLVRLGRRMQLGYDEAAALLEVLEDEPGAAVEQGRPGKRARTIGDALRRCPHSLLAQLRAVPGLFLLTDGVTPSRMERAWIRLRGVEEGSARIVRFLARAEIGAAREAGVLERVTRALLQGVRAGRVPAPQWGQTGAALLAALTPLLQGSGERQRQAGRGKSAERQPVKPDDRASRNPGLTSGQKAAGKPAVSRKARPRTPRPQ